MKLTKKQKAKWLKALRSGEYSQTTGTLYNENTQGFCCLGVLQHCLSGGKVEYDEENWLGETEPKKSPSAEWYDDNGIYVKTIGGDDDYSYREVRDADETMLMNMNDGNVGLIIKKRGFRGIAQWIERNVETID